MFKQTAKVPDGQYVLIQEMNVRFVNIMQGVSLEDLMDLNKEDVYGSGTIEDPDSVENSYLFFLLVNFLKSLENEEENPNRFVTCVLRYICSKDPEKISKHPSGNGADVVRTRCSLVQYINYQYNKVKFSKEELSELKLQIKKWIPRLKFTLYKYPNHDVIVEDVRDVTVEELKNITVSNLRDNINEYLETIRNDPNQEAADLALVKLYIQLGFFSLRRVRLHDINLREICDRLWGAMKGEDFKQHIPGYQKTMNRFKRI